MKRLRMMRRHAGVRVLAKQTDCAHGQFKGLPRAYTVTYTYTYIVTVTNQLIGSQYRTNQPVRVWDVRVNVELHPNTHSWQGIPIRDLAEATSQTATWGSRACANPLGAVYKPAALNTPNLPTIPLSHYPIIPTKIGWLNISGKFPMGMIIPPLEIKILNLSTEIGRTSGRSRLFQKSF